MTYDILTNYNFTDAQIEIYRILIEQGESTVSEVLANTSLSRTSVHDALNDLLVRELVEYRKEGRNAYYKAVHPNKLYALLEEKKQTTARLNAEMEEVIRSMVGSYNLGESKPGVRFFEGEEGVQEALYDSLQASDTVYVFVDSAMVETFGGQLNANYRAARLQKQIKKQVIISDSAYADTYERTITDSITEVRRMSHTLYPFAVAVEIYDDTVSFIMINDTIKHAFLIKHPLIAEFHKSLFRYTWDTISTNSDSSQNHRVDLNNHHSDKPSET